MVVGERGLHSHPLGSDGGMVDGRHLYSPSSFARGGNIGPLCHH